MAKKNPYLTTCDTHGTTSERRVVKGVGGRLTPASGALKGAKSDGTWDTPSENYRLRLESKATINASMSLKHDWLCKIASEARETNRQPVLVMSFTNGDGRAKKDGDWAMIPLWLLTELVGNLTGEE